MQITAMRALWASVHALGDAGLKPVPSIVEGWLRPHYANSVGFGIRRLGGDGGLEWNTRIDEATSVHWRPVRTDDGDGHMEPVDDERLHPGVRAIFEGLGLDVRHVRTTGWGGYWDKELALTVMTPHPDWLEGYDPGNAMPESPDPRLVGAVATGPEGRAPRGPFPAYVMGDAVFLTRESVAAMAAGTGREGPAFEFEGDILKVTRGTRPAMVIHPASIVNAWGDETKAWHMPRGSFRTTFSPDGQVPFLMDGEMRTKAPFPLLDAQYPDAPWTQAPPAPGP